MVLAASVAEKHDEDDVAMLILDFFTSSCSHGTAAEFVDAR